MEVRNISLPVSFLREGKRFIAYTPALDLSTSGKTFVEAKRRFEQATELFLEEVERMGTLEEVLQSLGWKKVARKWTAPVLIAQEESMVRLPA